MATADALARSRLGGGGRIGRWGASTQYALCVSRAILESGGVRLPVVAAHLRRWAESRDYRHPSPGLRRFLIRLRRGGPWDACAVSGWPGRGAEALLSAVPLAAWLGADPQARAQAVGGVVRISQRGRRAAEAARLAADVLAWALAAAPASEPPLAEIMGSLRGRTLRKRLRRLESARAGAPLRPTHLLRPQPRASQVVAAALEVSGIGEHGFLQAVEEALEWGEAGRHAAVLAGALVGARRGEAALPGDLVRTLEDADGIARLAGAIGGAETEPRRGLLPAVEIAAALAARAWRLTRVSAGSALVLLGLVGLFLPVLQGVLFLLSGLAVLGAEFPWARDLLRRLRVLLKRGLRRARRHRSQDAS